MGLTRRAFLHRTAALAAATWGASLWRPGLASARARTLASAIAPELTTLQAAFALEGDTGYRRLVEIPGWPIEVRGELAEAASGRIDRREPLASIVHLTDIHVIDAQSTSRVEFLDRYADPPTDPIPFDSAHRAQETLTAHVAEAMVQRINAIGAGPVTGRPYDVAVSTGDNTDNQQLNELDWFLRVLDGGPLSANSGDPSRYEGVQDTDPLTFDDHYWHPDDVGHPLTGEPDRFRRNLGYPLLPGLLEAAIAEFTATGLAVPWYSCYGNHDGLLQGNAPANVVLDAISTGPLKVAGLPAGVSPNDLAEGLASGDPAILNALLGGPARVVTADPARTSVSPTQWAATHLEDRGGPGPRGHGYDDHHVATGELYYAFPISEEVLGICLDTVNRGGYADGSLGQAQLDWLEARLVEAHGRYFDTSGSEVTTGNADRLVVLFSHHNIPTMSNPIPDPAMLGDARLDGTAVEAFLHRFPNVIGWVNGHSHVNRVWPRPDPSGRTGGFWEINTAAHVDAPQHARIVEVVDNHDGTLSIFGTLIEHAAPARAPMDGRSLLDLASFSRELAYNDGQADLADKFGQPTDRNVELLLTRPFARQALAAPPATDDEQPQPAPPSTPSEPPTTDPTAGPTLPATGASPLGLVAGMGAIGAAALLGRRQPAEEP